jgi:uncharacterized PurR-regulated membrane protein YhhQ (DUF165 family)
MTAAVVVHRRSAGWAAWCGFLASIPFANWWLDRFGFWVAPVLGPLPSALWVVAFSFTLRDVAQVVLGRRLAWVAIAAGTVLSVWFASPQLAIASGAAFAISETTDAAVFTPLADRGRFLLGVTLSGYLAGFVDSAVFLRIGFGSVDGWWQLGVAKALVIVAATPLAVIARRLVVEP